ncbi:MAG: outer membrane protein heavy metal efflux system [Actinomycetota bacterium]|nr:outer membrane protein heavy metal efflux system [Actinomycetota bacterium]
MFRSSNECRAAGRGRLGPRSPLYATIAGLIFLVGCSGKPIPSERAARDALRSVTESYRPGNVRPALPQLTPTSPLIDYLRFAMLSSPRVEAAYYDWAAAVERITPARSLPDPRLTFEADIADTVMSLMPGLMIELPGPGKLRAAGNVMAAEADVAYFSFEREVLATALAVKTAYYRLHFLEETIRVQRRTLELVGELERLAQQQNAAGRVTLQDVFRAQIARDQLETAIQNLEDSRSTLGAQFKAALGLGPFDADPPLPVAFEPSTGDPQPESVLKIALARNPSLRAMESDVRRAEVSIRARPQRRRPGLLFRGRGGLEGKPDGVETGRWHHAPGLARQDRRRNRSGAGGQARRGGEAQCRTGAACGRTRVDALHVSRSGA